jgi:uncharacterized phage protein (TIGR01671 family)
MNMREILFRGKRTDNGEWVEGGFAYGGNRGESLICPQYDFTKEVIPETVGQYTGLTDKNGKKIFEGDLIRENSATWLVAFEDGAFVCKDPKYNTYFSFFEHREYIKERKTFEVAIPIFYEVVGNIHDNPEFLKGK